MVSSVWKVAAATLCFVLAARAFPLAARQADQDAQNVTIFSYLQDDERFSTLVQLLNETGLAEELNSTEVRYTMFAPTDDAFQNFDNATVQNYTETQLLSYHVLPFIFGSQNLTELCVFANQTNGNQTNETAQSDAENACQERGIDQITIALRTLLNLEALDDEPLRVKVSSDDLETLNRVKNVTIAEEDISVQNGMIHIIDEVLIPPGNITTVLANPEPVEGQQWPVLEELRQLFDDEQQAKRNASLFVDNSTTILFMPSNNSTQNETVECIVDYVRQNQSEALLREVLEYHLATDRLVYISDLLYGNVTNGTQEGDDQEQQQQQNQTMNERSATVMTVAGETIELRADLETNKVFIVGDGVNATVVDNARFYDIQARNGVVHFIDGLLVPPEFLERHNITC